MIHKQFVSKSLFKSRLRLFVFVFKISQLPYFVNNYIILFDYYMILSCKNPTILKHKFKKQNKID